MTDADAYEDLAQLFTYPWRKEPLADAVQRLAGRAPQLEALAAFVGRMTLGKVQEEFVAAFDLDPRCAPYAGHHLYGEHQMRAEYLVRLKEVYRRHGFEGGAGEPPDHLATMFRFAAHLARLEGEEGGRAFVDQYLQEGLRRLRRAAQVPQRSVWEGAVTAACSLCAAETGAAETEEVDSCSIPSSL